MNHHFTAIRRTLIIALCLGLMIVAISAAAVSAAVCTTVCYVDAATGNDANDGDTPATAKQTIQAAVNQVTAGGQVIVAAGVYIENVTISQSLTLTGAGQTDDAAGTVLDGSTLLDKGIYINAGVTDVTIENLRIEDYKNATGSGIWAHGSNDNFTVQYVTVDNNGVPGITHAGGVYMNGPVDNVLIDHVTANNNNGRGIEILGNAKTNIKITNNTATNNTCCGIELQIGTASGVTMTGNTSTGNSDSGMSAMGLTSGAGPNLIANNTLDSNGRFGLEIRLPDGTGLDTGDGSIVVEDNDISLTTSSADLRDYAGIAVFRQYWAPVNADIPTGVIVRNNTVTGYAQNNVGSFSEGFGISVEGTNMTVTGNTLNNNDVGLQVQGGHLPYVANTGTNGDQSNLSDLFFGRGNSPVGCAAVSGNTFSGNTIGFRTVGTGLTAVAQNVDTGEVFCTTIQAAIDDSDTLNGHTIEVFPGTYAENVIVNKSLTLNGANAGISPNDPITPLNPNGARGPETEMAVTGAGVAFSVQTADVTIDGFKFTNSAVGTTTNIQVPIIGAGVAYGGDAPGVKILNNRFVDTSRVLVNFNGPALMAGGTIEHNRVENPTRAAGICGVPPAAAPGSCGYQLFNPHRTDDLSFQHNVAFAPAGNRDRVRTINVSWSTDVVLSYNTLRYTCIYTCISIPLDASPVEVSYNDAVTDAGQVLALHPTWTTGTVNAHHNLMTTGADFPISIDNLTADLDNVHINRNAIFGAYHVRNGNDSLTIPGAETLDTTCNWWGSAAGPTPANFYGPVDFTPWLTTADLDGLCAEGIYMSATLPGITGDGLAFGMEDIIMWDGVAWSMWFDGSAAGLAPTGKWKHNINAFWIPDASADDVLISFTQNRRYVPGIAAPVNGMDLVWWDGSTFSLYFDGEDVGLNQMTQEKIDSLHVLPGSESPIGGSCLSYLLLSTQGPGRVTAYDSTSLRFGGEDVLGFCLTNAGSNTTGFWHMVLDGSAEGMPRNATDSISMSADGDTMYLTTRRPFNVDSASGGHSMVYAYDFGTGTFSGPVFDAPANGLPRMVDGLNIVDLP
ncbi:MAG TPA: right-handed parallel beta-helix repeat-containing protein [Promineifilum sp.]|nr:right-handed parallel beta-helix repeat-containing protein [Promineifilum sp.]